MGVRMEPQMESLRKRWRALWYQLPPSPRHLTFDDEKGVRISLDRGIYALVHTTNRVKQWSRRKALMLLALVGFACLLQLRVASRATQDPVDDALFLKRAGEPVSLQQVSSSWSCTEQLDWNLQVNPPSKDPPLLQSAKRRQQCEVRNLCVDAQGAFVLSAKNTPPPINLIAGDRPSDQYFQPRAVTPKHSLKAHLVNETLFVYGRHNPSQFSHWLYNGVMPLQSTMRRFGGTKSSWLLRASTIDNSKDQAARELDDLFPPSHFQDNGRRVFDNRELVLHPAEVTSSFQTLPPKDAPICFERAVIGLGSQCPFHYCEQSIPSSLYTDYQTSISQFYWPTRARWIDYVLTRHQGIDSWKESMGWGRYEEPLNYLGAQEKQVGETLFRERFEGTPLQCLWNTMYFNFEEDAFREYRMWVDPLLRHSQEPLSRLGVADPDRIYRKKELGRQEEEDAEEQEMQRRGVNPKDSDRGSSGRRDKSRRKIVVAIVQREKSRSLLNIDELTQRLVSDGYRVKQITFDHGCGIPQMAYLLRDVDLLISPYGNALGTSIFLPRRPHVTTVSIDTSFAPENRFIWTTAAIGQRYLQHHFGPDFQAVARDNVKRELKKAAEAENTKRGQQNETIATNNQTHTDQLVAAELARLQARYPPVRDMKLARQIRDQIWGATGGGGEGFEAGDLRQHAHHHQYAKIAGKLTDEDLRRLMGERPQDDAQLLRKVGGAVAVIEAFQLEYWRASARYVDVDHLAGIAALVDREARELARGRLVSENESEAGRGGQDGAGVAGNEAKTTQQHQQQKRVPYTYLDLCRENRCCGHACEAILRRVLVGDHAALGKHAESGPEWGYHRGSDGVLRAQKTAQDKANEYEPGQLLDWKLEL